MTEPSMENLAWYALNHRIAPQHLASKELDALEEFVSKMCIAAGDRWREEWSEACNDNQILSNTCDESLAFAKELTKERDALGAVLAEIAQINPYDTSSMGFVVAKAQAAILRHNAGGKPPSEAKSD